MSLEDQEEEESSPSQVECTTFFRILMIVLVLFTLVTIPAAVLLELSSSLSLLVDRVGTEWLSSSSSSWPKAVVYFESKGTIRLKSGRPPFSRC